MVTGAAFAARRNNPMKHVSVRQVGNSLYVRVPRPWAKANNLADNDIALLVPVEGRTDKFEVTLVKLPVPPELQEEIPEPQSEMTAVAPDAHEVCETQEAQQQELTREVCETQEVRQAAGEAV
jgi:hypothetical protein